MYIAAKFTHLVLKLYRNKNLRFSFKAVLLKLFHYIAPFSHSTRRFHPPSLIKQTEGSKFKELYLKKLLNS